MKIKMVDVYAIAVEPILARGDYTSRFLDDVFERKADARAALRDVAREFTRKTYGVGGQFETELKRDEAVVTCRCIESGEDREKEDVLRIEKVEIPDGKINFVDGRAKVNNWRDVLTKDPRFKNWSVSEWVKAFIDAHRRDVDVQLSDADTSNFSTKELLECCDWWKFRGMTDVDLVCPAEFAIACPWFMEHAECELINLSAKDWTQVLRERPDLENKCTKWDKFEGWEWADLLSYQSRFATRCDWRKFNGNDWMNLLVRCPESERSRFASYCQWDKLDGYNWMCLLGNCAESDRLNFASRCEWEKLQGSDWVALLKKIPEFADKCNWNLLCGRDWCELLVEIPELEKHLIVERLKDGSVAGCGWLPGFLEKFPRHIADCNLDELGDGWSRFLKTYPQYADRCDFSKFCADDWGALLPSRPEFVDKVDWSIDWARKYYGSCVLLDLITNVKEVYEKCNWGALRGKVLVEILAKYPDIAEKCNMAAMSKSDWFGLLLRHPNFGAQCPFWDEFNSFQIGKLIETHDEFLKYLNIGNFTSEKLTDLLIVLPSVKDNVDFSKIDNDVDRLRLCAARPQLNSFVSGSDVWRGNTGCIWNGKSGPVVVVPVQGLVTKEGKAYPMDGEECVGQYSEAYGIVIRRGKQHYNERMEDDCAQRVVDEIFGRHTQWCHRAIAIDGVYVGKCDRDGVANFAKIMQEWFEKHETSIKLLYLEYGYYYDLSALECLP